MTFDSLEFLIFFVIVCGVCLFMQHRGTTLRNGFLLIASYIFYGFWSPPFVILIVISTLVDYYLAHAIDQASTQRVKKQLLLVSVVVNLGILGFFKYYNFFIDSALMVLPEGSFASPALDVILPVGISFYTFQSMSYSIDVYRGKLKPSNRLVDFALYVAFFPQLVAGPIERATNMLPQFERQARVSIDRTIEGIDLCIRGYFKKVVIADNLAPLVNLVFGDVDSANSLGLWVASYAFAIQLYADFSAYTDIARGTSKILGFELMENFKFPYRSKNISEFWRRWHISLSTWLRDYLYIPLGGNLGGKASQLRNLFIVMALGGLWHGAAWNYVLWGLYHGTLLVLYHVSVPFIASATANLNNTGKKLFTFLSWVLTFHCVIIGWVMFRAQSVTDLVTALTKMFVEPISDLLSTGLMFIPNAGPGEQLFYVTIIVCAVAAQFSIFDPEKWKFSEKLTFRGARGAVALAFLFFLYPTVKEQFIYFQF
jgi:alginate O-acetyltransferase complex protein AlgI